MFTMFTRLSDNSIKKRSREKSGVAESRAPRSPNSLYFCYLKNISKIYSIKAFACEDTKKRFENMALLFLIAL